MKLSLIGQTVLVTGAARGIGLSVTQTLLGAGANVIATDVNLDLLLANTEALQAQHPAQLQCDRLDLKSPQTIPAVIASLNDKYGPITDLASCAGILHLGSLSEMDFTAVQDTFMVNAFGALAVMQALSGSMKQAGRGAMVVVGSNAANTPRPNMGAYPASKAALHMMVKSIGIELAPHGIRCNLVSPGSTRTEMQQQLWTESYGESQVIAGDTAQYRLGIPLQKIAEPEDIANTVLFLLSEAANHITMHDLRVDGGATLDN
ncbi:2,3-dihydro-2,3-dihydroxybenzoate dehydrogenase [Photobacterium atrarenae]|uniref:2,3-dihydro-2,3-dihydroxybenzoate dehydrogenase n=1 Tax=Photobacterium atrarenae TaxID=865757 RepID=A0ABY5GNU0_9GAMM|nr:2,3-dihydro-2,3-dihydroxybenzoate dehydrogenase [Photobacterium atrarenae]UTV30749.1 2,3-dihydro-2,3-dihydroxybenzoate dehydrogenase [Photobacterium atrarenae]